ncbi:MAG: GIY-YIG nuclease family protein [Candidatus Helarchaeota archaeon]
MTEYTYFISDGTAIKIGKSEDPLARLRGIQTGNPRELKLLGVSKKLTETEFHEKFKKELIRGEWYNQTPEILLFCEEYKDRIRIPKTIILEDDLHRELDIIRAERPTLKTFGDVIEFLLECWRIDRA